MIYDLLEATTLTGYFILGYALIRELATKGRFL